MRMDTRRGFTLLELSIVLVVIGLVAGGILLARELIGTAQVRKINKAASSLKRKGAVNWCW